MRLVFLTCLEEDELQALDQALGHPILARTLDDLERLHDVEMDDAVLLSFGTSVIVPPRILGSYRSAYNLHAASPDYPGRDPHHFAVYDGVERYGATLHIMTERIDDGPIVDVEMFDVPKGTTPRQLLLMANDAAKAILHRTGKTIARGHSPSPIGLQWGRNKRKRSDFLAMCHLPADISEQEFNRRYLAFDGGEHDNLTIQLHGQVFRIDKAAK